MELEQNSNVKRMDHGSPLSPPNIANYFHSVKVSQYYYDIHEKLPYIENSIVIFLIIHAILLEKPCSHPEFSSPTIANGTLEINGKRQGGLQVQYML